MRCPGHAIHSIHFSGYGYSEYIKKALELLGINRDRMEGKKYETWTPYQPT